LLYATFSTADRILLPERHRLTFVLATAAPGIEARQLAERIAEQTGFKARASSDFKADTVRWFLVNSEDVGDIAAMLTLAMSVGFGVVGILLYIFTSENLKQYAVLKAMGATSGMLLGMVFVQAGFCALLGTGFGLGLCGIIGEIASGAGYPFRMLWYTPLIGTLMVLLVSVIAAVFSARPVLKLEPGIVFAGRSLMNASGQSAVSSAHPPCPLFSHRNRIAALRWRTRPAKSRKLTKRARSGDDTANPAAAIPLITDKTVVTARSNLPAHRRTSSVQPRPKTHQRSDRLHA
jgi:hypothetical protein